MHTIGTRVPCCERMTRPAPAHALCVWGTWLVQHRHQWGLGVPRCLKQSRQMLVLSGPPVSHTISTSEALLRADAWTSIDSCLLLVGAPGWHNISTGGTLVLVLFGHLSRTPSALERLVASECLDQHRLMPCVSGASPTSAPVGSWCTKVPRAI